MGWKTSHCMHTPLSVSNLFQNHPLCESLWRVSSSLNTAENKAQELPEWKLFAGFCTFPPLPHTRKMSFTSSKITFPHIRNFDPAQLGCLKQLRARICCPVWGHRKAFCYIWVGINGRHGQGWRSAPCALSLESWPFKWVWMKHCLKKKKETRLQFSRVLSCWWQSQFPESLFLPTQ